jgi:hypothetical protein
MRKQRWGGAPRQRRPLGTGGREGVHRACTWERLNPRCSVTKHVQLWNHPNAKSRCVVNNCAHVARGVPPSTWRHILEMHHTAPYPTTLSAVRGRCDPLPTPTYPTWSPSLGTVSSFRENSLGLLSRH